MLTMEFLRAVIFTLWDREVLDSFDSSDPTLHASIAAAIDEVGIEQLLAQGIELYVDPITNQVAEVFKLAAEFQGYRLARRSNPQYHAQMHLTLGKSSVRRFLSRVPTERRLLIQQFATAVATSLPTKSSSSLIVD